ncbi:hypothetical protein ANO14919_028620 [Xylariales sp. No.14919]|nr:hypothetical protein ANO14919_028620 [Xylariales sp. No.14919]
MLLFGRIEKWEDVLPEAAGYDKPPFEGARVILDLATERAVAQSKHQPFQFEHIAQMSKDQWIQRLEELMSTYKWSFIDDKNLPVEALDFNPVGGMFTGMCLLNSRRLTLLLGDSITLAERCQMYYNLLVSVRQSYMNLRTGSSLPESRIILPVKFGQTLGAG